MAETGNDGTKAGKYEQAIDAYGSVENKPAFFRIVF
jgi:hypothetical protein